MCSEFKIYKAKHLNKQEKSRFCFFMEALIPGSARVCQAVDILKYFLTLAYQ